MSRSTTATAASRSRGTRRRAAVAIASVTAAAAVLGVLTGGTAVARTDVGSAARSGSGSHGAAAGPAVTRAGLAPSLVAGKGDDPVPDFFFLKLVRF